MADFSVRDASSGDIDFLMELEQTCFPVSRQSSRRSIRNSLQKTTQQVLIIEWGASRNKRVPVGAVTLMGFKHTLRIFSIAVMPSFRGKGMGEVLMRYVRSFALKWRYAQLSLEVDCTNSLLVDWYRKFGFEVVATLPDYYGKGEPAYRMRHPLDTDDDGNMLTGHIIVVDSIRKCPIRIDGVDVVSAKDYLSVVAYRNSERYHILNLCDSYRTHTLGYYVSLVASARNHRVIPSVVTVKDITRPAIAQSLLDDFGEQILKSLSRLKEDRLELTVILGDTPNAEFAALARKLFSIFKCPMFRVLLVHMAHGWRLRKITSLDLEDVLEQYPELAKSAIESYFQRKQYRRTQLRQSRYDLAILVNPQEKTPPSCPVALDNFRQAGEELGFSVEFIGRMDYQRLAEFDALFIRETTAIENHTYAFARHGYTEGLVVIDDPWSILYCSNKIYLHERLSRARVRQPRSWLLSKQTLKSPWVRSLPFPLVLKLPESSFSRGVFCVEDMDELHAKLKILFEETDLVIAQESMRTSFDWRIGVLDNQPLFACKYYMAKGHWQVYNWADTESEINWGKCETLPIEDVPPHVVKTAIKACSLIGDGLYGVDLKEVDGQAYVIEINDNPNIDESAEDRILGKELYLRIMRSFMRRIETNRGVPRYVV